MEKIKRVLKVLGYIIGGLICSTSIVGVATLIVLTIYVTIGWLMSFESISLIIQWIMYIFVGAAVLFMGFATFIDIVESVKSKMIK